MSLLIVAASFSRSVLASLDVIAEYQAVTFHNRALVLLTWPEQHYADHLQGLDT